MRSRRILTQRRQIIASSNIPARFTRSRTPKPPSSARSSTYRSDTTPKWIRKRRPKRPSSLPLTLNNKQKKPHRRPFQSVAESSQLMRRGRICSKDDAALGLQASFKEGNHFSNRFGADRRVERH